MLKDAFMVLVPQLVFMFNFSFSKGVFPNAWKQATIIPLFKGVEREVSNYRPVSLLPLPGKLLEKIAHAQLSGFLEENGMISDKQGGLRKGFSAASSIADLTDSLLTNINRGLTSLAAFVDLRKAFDTADHSILIRKLKCYGVTDNNLEWWANYLNNRLQRTLANGIMSQAHGISCGVPQGSVIGPLFSILYVHDMQAAIRDSDVQLYAGDTVIHAEGISSDAAVRKHQPAMNQFSL